MNKNYYESFDFQKRLKLAQKFQDFWVLQIWNQLNIAISVFCEQMAQWNIGESIQGFEFKHDSNFAKTNNLWIETQQRNTKELVYKNSGIYQNDNCWLYCIGNYEELFLFGKKNLKHLFKDNSYPVIESHAKTTKGFLLSREQAERSCVYKIIAKSNFTKRGIKYYE